MILLDLLPSSSPRTPHDLLSHLPFVDRDLVFLGEVVEDTLGVAALDETNATKVGYGVALLDAKGAVKL
jgi:hypothetical protein